MEKNLDPWEKIASLIEKDKEKALADFHKQKFEHAAMLEIRPAERSFRLLVCHPAFLAAAASLLLVVGLVSFWLLRESWEKAKAVPALKNVLADSFLYGNSSEPKEKTSETRAVSPFSSVLSAWEIAAGLSRAAAPAAKPIASSAPIERGDPELVRQKIAKVIQENAIERMLTQFCQICKEV